MGRSADLPRTGDGGNEHADDTGCNVLHVDMDAFFASVEVRRNPELRGKALIVGGYGKRGVVTSATYEARAYGVRSAMPMSRALRLCPHAVVLPGNHADYCAVSTRIMEIFSTFTPLVQPLSLDEAFLQIGGAIRLLGRPREIAQKVRATIEAEEGITCSVGVAPTMFVSKIASTMSKPNGLLVVPKDRVLEFLHPLSVTALWGVGPRTAETLRSLGLRTIGELSRARPQTLSSNLGAASAAHLSALAMGLDPRTVSTARREKSIGAEETFYVDTDDLDQIRTEILRLSQKVGAKLRTQHYETKTINLKVRYADFTTISRSRTLAAATESSRDIYDSAGALFDELVRTDLDGQSLRLIGVRAEGLVPSRDSPRQLLLGEPEHGWSDAERVVDELTARFGGGVVRPATLVKSGENPPNGARRATSGSPMTVDDSGRFSG